MQEIERIVIPIKNKFLVDSLAWVGNDLVDWTHYRKFCLDQSVAKQSYAYTYRFDAAISTSDGTYAIIYERLGTKALLLNQEGRVIREINRSYYYANATGYPIAFLTLPEGEIAIAHCPDKYNCLEIEVALTGERLTRRESKPLDYFHSRLVVSSNQRYLLSAGWFWGRLDSMQVYDVAQVYQDPTLLDQLDDFQSAYESPEISSATYYDDASIIFTTSPDEADEIYKNGLFANALAVLNLETKKYRSLVMLEEQAGALMPLGDYVVGFYQHPKLIELSTGRVIQRWPNLVTGDHSGPILNHSEKVPPIAMDTANKRFAVASQDEITIIQLG